MGFKLRMTKLMGGSFTSELEDPSDTTIPKDPRRARIFADDFPICTIANRNNCYDPDSLKKAFHPLGTFCKCFGLFPCYDFAFVESLTEQKVRLVHIFDYCYSALIFLLLLGGAIVCQVYQPNIIKASDQNLDYFVKMGLIYATIFAGVQSLFIFPMKWNGVLNFVKHFSNIDKILRFDGRMEERWFAKKVIFYLIGCLIYALGSFHFLFIFEGKGTPCSTDYLMVVVMTLALMALVIPTGLAIFFLNAMRLRMEHFNRKIAFMVKKFIPNCCPCTSFFDYGKELDADADEKDEKQDGKGKDRIIVMETKPVKDNLAEDLEKMRILHCEIRTLGNLLSCIFGMHLVRDVLYSLVALVLYTYFLIYAPDNEGKYVWIIYGGQSVFILLKIYVMVLFAQLIGCQVKN